MALVVGSCVNRRRTGGTPESGSKLNMRSRKPNAHATTMTVLKMKHG